MLDIKDFKEHTPTPYYENCTLYGAEYPFSIPDVGKAPSVTGTLEGRPAVLDRPPVVCGALSRLHN
jgi:hypothetical protein